MSTTTTPKAPQGAVPAVNIPDSQDYPRLVFTAPYFQTVPLAELIEPAVIEAVESALPALVPPYVTDAANAAVQQNAVLLSGSTMQGPLFLNPVLPTQPSQAASMSYVDMMVATAGVPEVPPVPQGQTWARQTGQWVPISEEEGTFLPLGGGTMQGAINMSGNGITNLPAVPSMPNGAASAQWVLNQISAQSLYQGTWTPDTNTPDLTLPGTHQNGFTWIATTTAVGGVVVSYPIPGLQGLTIFNGDTIIYAALVGQFQAIHAGGLSLPEAQSLFVQLSGSQMSGSLFLNADPTSAMEAATRQWVLAQTSAAGLPEAPADGQLYGRNGATKAWTPSLPLAGGILTGSLSLNGNAVASLNAVPLQQLTSSLANYVPLAGNVTMTGPLTMGSAATLTLNNNAATPLGAVPLQQLTATLASYAPILSPAFTGTPSLPTGTTGVTQPPGTANTTLATTAFVAAAEAPALHDVGRNLIHNALFGIAQRGVGPWTTGGAYTVDRWVIQQTTDTVSFGVSPLTDAARAQIGDEAAIQALNNNFTGNAAAGAMNAIEQRIERVSLLSGKTITVSFWAIAGTGGLRLGTNIYQVFGSGGSPSATVTVLATGNAVTLTTSWTRYSFTVAMPSDAGKTFGTNGNDSTYLRFFYSSGATNNAQAGNIGVQSGSIAIWGIQLEIGTVATPLDYGGSPQQQLAQCQRFYQNNPNLALFAYNTAGGTCTWPVVLPVPMRATPTITPTFSGGTNTGTVSVVNVAANSFCPSIIAVATGAVGAQMSFTASADL